MSHYKDGKGPHQLNVHINEKVEYGANLKLRTDYYLEL